MKTLLISATLIFCFFSLPSFAQHVPFPSGVPGLTIPNSQRVGNRVFRGSEPRKLVSELKSFGITDVVIFKKDNKGEVEREAQDLKSLGYQDSQILKIPMRWDQLESDAITCTQVLTALRILIAVEASPNRKAYFHCTSGEDRTGMLAGLFRMTAQGWTKDRAFRDEMCAHGYEAGDPNKAWGVVTKIRQNLTPIFLAIADQVQAGKITAANVNPGLCQQLNFAAQMERINQYQCSRQ